MTKIARIGRERLLSVLVPFERLLLFTDTSEEMVHMAVCANAIIAEYPAYSPSGLAL